jgi:hypothetical protein
VLLSTIVSPKITDFPCATGEIGFLGASEISGLAARATPSLEPSERAWSTFRWSLATSMDRTPESAGILPQLISETDFNRVCDAAGIEQIFPQNRERPTLAVHIDQPFADAVDVFNHRSLWKGFGNVGVLSNTQQRFGQEGFHKLLMFSV